MGHFSHDGHFFLDIRQLLLRDAVWTGLHDFAGELLLTLVLLNEEDLGRGSDTQSF
jgi:hypothetical protein